MKKRNEMNHRKPWNQIALGTMLFLGMTNLTLAGELPEACAKKMRKNVEVVECPDSGGVDKTYCLSYRSRQKSSDKIAGSDNQVVHSYIHLGSMWSHRVSFNVKEVAERCANHIEARYKRYKDEERARNKKKNSTSGITTIRN